jgi:hypothetical protein
MTRELTLVQAIVRHLHLQDQLLIEVFFVRMDPLRVEVITHADQSAARPDTGSRGLSGRKVISHHPSQAQL